MQTLKARNLKYSLGRYKTRKCVSSHSMSCEICVCGKTQNSARKVANK